MLKRLSFVVIILIATYVLLAQQAALIDMSEVSVNASGERVFNGDLLTGSVVSYFDNGSIRSIDDFVEGRRHGFSRKWFADGVLGYESRYEKGQRSGYTRSWWFNGNMRSERFFEAGKPEGEAWAWYRNGNVFKRFNFNNGKPVGVQQAWRLNGTLFSNFQYKNGRVFGLKKSNNCVGLEDEQISFDYYRDQAAGI